MITSSILKIFDIGAQQLQVYVPDVNIIRENYQQAKKEYSSTAFPYWAQVWPAALGLCEFLADHLSYIQDKRILELGAGLGLPSLFASRYAKEVIASDINPDAVELMRRSAQQNGIKNMQSRLLNWNHLPVSLHADVLLISDVNYDPVAFETLYAVLKKFAADGTIIVLSTPQRLLAKPFIARLLPLCTAQDEILVELDQKQSIVTVMILQ